MVFNLDSISESPLARRCEVEVDVTHLSFLEETGEE
jgi:hypothetical protein